MRVLVIIALVHGNIWEKIRVGEIHITIGQVVKENQNVLLREKNIPKKN
jgi:hypothetical protein